MAEKRVRPDKIRLKRSKVHKKLKAKEQYYFLCKDGDNGEVRWTTEMYSRKSTARSLAVKYAVKHSNYRVYDFDGSIIYPKPKGWEEDG